MNKLFSRFWLLFVFMTGSSILISFQQKPNVVPISFPYKKTGLSKEQAAAHLLSRFSYGAAPGQIEAVTQQGLENWFSQQLEASSGDAALNTLLLPYSSLQLSNRQINETYPRGAQLLNRAIKDSVISRSEARKDGNKKYKKDLKEYMEEKGYKTQAELNRDLINQKILRAAYSENQLQEVLTSFWFNHFNVTVEKGVSKTFVLSYERDVIRPNALGKFETLVLATAKSPAMLTYLDNFKSVAGERKNGRKVTKKSQMMSTDSLMANKKNKIKKASPKGLNENYAREIMELHTLGVDGGYTQRDVTQAARIFTGWTINPAIDYKTKNPRKLDNESTDFLFVSNRHDKGAKNVLGTQFPAGGGYEEGEKLIHLLATHPSTAKFISKKLAMRFVSDNPPQSLIDKMAKTFLTTEGNIKEVLTTMVSAPEFWNKEALGAKTKSPFEVVISAVRNTNAQINNPYQLFQWMSKMGEKIYYYQAPTGFPDRAQYWINTGALLNRMNFGLAFATQRIPGVKLDLLALNHNREPESTEAALKTYVQYLLPHRNTQETINRLTPLLNDPELQKKVKSAADQTPTSIAAQKEEQMMTENKGGKKGKNNEALKKQGNTKNKGQLLYTTGNNTMLAQVVGIIIGSPEFQRR